MDEHRAPGRRYPGDFDGSAQPGYVLRRDRYRAIQKPGCGWKLGEVECAEPALRLRSRRTRTRFTRSAESAGSLQGCTDGGNTWNAANSGLPLQGYLPPQVFALVIDPLNSSNLYVGTWHGIFKSTDRGTNWNSVNSGIPVLNNPGQSLPYSVPCLAIDPRNPNTLYAVENGYATQYGVIVAGGLFKSADGGGSWNPLNLGLPPNSSIDAVAVNPQDPSTLYVGSIYGIFKSTDGGSDWTPVNSGLPAFANGIPGGGAAYFSVDSLAIDPQQPDTVYAAIANSIGSMVLKTTNGGASWSDAGSGLPENTTVRSLRIGFADPDHALCGDRGRSLQEHGWSDNLDAGQLRADIDGHYGFGNRSRDLRHPVCCDLRRVVQDHRRRKELERGGFRYGLCWFPVRHRSSKHQHHLRDRMHHS